MSVGGRPRRLRPRRRRPRWSDGVAERVDRVEDVGRLNPAMSRDQAATATPPSGSELICRRDEQPRGDVRRRRQSSPRRNLVPSSGAQAAPMRPIRQPDGCPIVQSRSTGRNSSSAAVLSLIAAAIVRLGFGYASAVVLKGRSPAARSRRSARADGTN